MDVNMALENARAAAEEVAKIRYRHGSVTQMLDSFEALDQWLSRGGFLPNAWQVNR
jgi:hypothetical protein